MNEEEILYIFTDNITKGYSLDENLKNLKENIISSNLNSFNLDNLIDILSNNYNINDISHFKTSYKSFERDIKEYFIYKNINIDNKNNLNIKPIYVKDNKIINKTINKTYYFNDIYEELKDIIENDSGNINKFFNLLYEKTIYNDCFDVDTINLAILISDNTNLDSSNEYKSKYNKYLKDLKLKNNKENLKKSFEEIKKNKYEYLLSLKNKLKKHSKYYKDDIEYFELILKEFQSINYLDDYQKKFDFIINKYKDFLKHNPIDKNKNKAILKNDKIKNKKEIRDTQEINSNNNISKNNNLFLYKLISLLIVALISFLLFYYHASIIYIIFVPSTILLIFIIFGIIINKKVKKHTDN